ncbi:hypothetical protein KSF78_0003788 [Schistosoma japonicum]|nr:hypothetical protein KSF78_0003788 [Schistosoma japonicum]
MMDKWPHSAIYIPGSIGEYELTSRNQEINEITLPCHQNISDSEDSRILLGYLISNYLYTSYLQLINERERVD